MGKYRCNIFRLSEGKENAKDAIILNIDLSFNCGKIMKVIILRRVMNLAGSLALMKALQVPPAPLWVI